MFVKNLRHNQSLLSTTFVASAPAVAADWDGKIYAFLVPMKDGKVTLPDRFWGWGYYDCSDFRPDLDENGYLKKGGTIRCHVKETPEWGASLWQWSYSGEPKDKWGIEMYSPAVDIANGTLYINQ